MTIIVEGTPSQRNIILNLMKKLCSSVKLTGDRIVLINSRVPMIMPSCGIIEFLIKNEQNTVFITALNGPHRFLPRQRIETIGSKSGGATIPQSPTAGMLQLPLRVDGRARRNIGSTSQVCIDITDNNRRGYYTYDKQGNPINFPLFIILGHELCHAHQFSSGTAPRTSITREVKARIHENRIRNGTRAPNGRPYSRRAGHMGGMVGTRGVNSRPPDNRR